MRLTLFFTTLFLLLMGACSVPKDVVYFQGVDALSLSQIEEISQTYNTKIAPDDLLNISVGSSDPSVVTPFNLPVYSYAQQGEDPIAPAGGLYTYAVDKEGNIDFPVLGRIHVAGLTKRELRDELKNKIVKYVKDPLVTVQITNFKVMVLGEVTRPGGLAVKGDRISILDAIGYSGDLTINANRKNILVIREREGKKEFGRMDITDPGIFASPFYYLQQNDVVYVEPNPAKQRNSNYSQSKQYNITVFSSILSTVSVITTVVLAISNAKK